MGWENDFHVYAMTMGTNNKYHSRQRAKTLWISGEQRLPRRRHCTLANEILPEEPCQFWFPKVCPEKQDRASSIVWNKTERNCSAAYPPMPYQVTRQQDSSTPSALLCFLFYFFFLKFTLSLTGFFFFILTKRKARSNSRFNT